MYSRVGLQQCIVCKVFTNVQCVRCSPMYSRVGLQQCIVQYVYKI